MHTLDVVVSRTNTIVGYSVRGLFGGSYNHCSLALDDDFDRMVSYTRKYKHLWFTGMFCCESVARLSNYEVFRIDLSDEEYDSIVEFLNTLWESPPLYNYIGALSLIFDHGFEWRDSYTCSTFVAKVLERVGAVHLTKSYTRYRPMDIYSLMQSQIGGGIVYG